MRSEKSVDQDQESLPGTKTSLNGIVALPFSLFHIFLGRYSLIFRRTLIPVANVFHAFYIDSRLLGNSNALVGAVNLKAE